MVRGACASAIVFTAILLSGCVAPVNIAAFPGAEADLLPSAPCRESDYQNVEVLGVLPDRGTFVQVGYMNLAQKSTSEFVSTSAEVQIQAARAKACQWGADAIVIVGTQGDQGTSWNFWTGASYREERESRIVAIRYVGSSRPTVGADQFREVASGTDGDFLDSRLSPADEYPIDLFLETAGTAVANITTANGEPIRTLTLEAAPIGSCSLLWDGRDSRGLRVATGPYRYGARQGDVAIASGWITVR